MVVYYSAYLVYSADSDTDATDSTRAEQAIANALVIVSFFLVATFVVVACYKYNFNRVRASYTRDMLPYTFISRFFLDT